MSECDDFDMCIVVVFVWFDGLGNVFVMLSDLVYLLWLCDLYDLLLLLYVKGGFELLYVCGFVVVGSCYVML